METVAEVLNDTTAKIAKSFDALKAKSVSGEILTAPDVHAYNDFGKEPAVKPAAFTGAKVSGGKVKVTLPAASVVVLEIK